MEYNKRAGMRRFLVDGPNFLALLLACVLRVFSGETTIPDCNNNGLDDLTASETPVALAAADLDGNGGSEIIVANLEGANVHVYTNRITTSPTTVDCNSNGAPDECDVDSGVSLDHNGNGVPDECEGAFIPERDCDENGSDDRSDIVRGTSVDCDNNKIPDQCLTEVLFGLTLQTSLFPGDLPFTILADHIDEDDLEDLAVLNRNSETVSIFPNPGSGVVTRQNIPVGPRPRGFAIADLNGDGFVDLATSHDTLQAIRG